MSGDDVSMGTMLDEMLTLGRDSWMNIARDTLDACRPGCPEGADPGIWYAIRCGELQTCVAGLLEVLGPTLAYSQGRHSRG